MSNNSLIESKFLPPETQEAFTDADYARKNLYDLIETGHAALSEIAQIAAQSQRADAYDILAKFLTSMGKLNEQLLDTSIKKKNIREAGAKDNNNGNVTNNLFVGTPAQLQEMLEQLKNKDG